MRTLAIDLGTRRVGIAMSDEGGRFATPIEVLQVTSPEMASDAVLKIIAKEGVERVVVGLPLNMDESIGTQARNAITWGRAIESRSGKPVIFVDERLSSFEADEQLTERKRGGERMTRQDRKQRLDAIAAASFLQAFLDGRLSAEDV